MNRLDTIISILIIIIIILIIIILSLTMAFCKHEVLEYNGEEVKKAGSYSEFYIKQMESE